MAEALAAERVRLQRFGVGSVALVLLVDALVVATTGQGWLGGQHHVVYGAVGLAALVLDARRTAMVVAVALLALGGLTALRVAVDGGGMDVVVPAGVGALLLVLLGAVRARLDRLEAAEREAIEAHVVALETLQRHAEALAAGRFAEPIPTDGPAAPLERMRRRLFALVQEVARTTEEVQAAAVELSATATQQASGATEQAAALAETRAMVGDVERGVAEVGQRMAEADGAVRRTAERTGELQRGLESLVETTAAIEELLDDVRRIAERTDVLAINAALEGVRAGAAGKGFGLVAAQVGRLAERVRDSVDQLVALNADVVAASERTQRAMAGTREALTGSLGRSAEARVDADRQRLAMAQVARAVEEIDAVTQGFAIGSRELRASSEHLTERVQRLAEAMQPFEGATVSRR